MLLFKRFLCVFTKHDFMIKIIKLFIFFTFLHCNLLAITQNIKTIHIDAANARPLNLSDIAEKVTPIVLEESKGGIHNILLTGEYLFISSLNSVIQYDLSGKFIRTINCGGYVADNVTSDTVKKELYIPVGDKIKCYDYAGNFKKEYSLKNSSLFSLYHKGFLWVQSHKIMDYAINSINLSTGKISELPFEKKGEPFKAENGSMAFISAACRLSLYNDEVIASFAFDNTLYKIQQDKLIPFVQWNISPPAQSYSDRNPLHASGFIGDYLFINYRRDDNLYFYLENMKTGKKFNVSNLVDDVFHTTGDCRISSMEQKGCFYFIKEKSEIKGNSIGNIPLKNGPVVFIVKIK